MTQIPKPALARLRSIVDQRILDLDNEDDRRLVVDAIFEGRASHQLASDGDKLVVSVVVNHRGVSLPWLQLDAARIGLHMGANGKVEYVDQER